MFFKLQRSSIYSFISYQVKRTGMNRKIWLHTVYSKGPRVKGIWMPKIGIKAPNETIWAWLKHSHTILKRTPNQWQLKIPCDVVTDFFILLFCFIVLSLLALLPGHPRRFRKLHFVSRKNYSMPACVFHVAVFPRATKVDFTLRVGKRQNILSNNKTMEKIFMFSQVITKWK